MRHPLLLAFCLAWTCSGALAGSLPPEKKVAIRALIAEARMKAPAPSTSVAILVDGELAYAETFGLAHLTSGEPASLETRYDIGSVAKQFTAAAALLLVEDGKLSLDDKVSRFFPALSGADTVTVRHLLSHTAGYRDSWTDTAEERKRPIAPQAVVDRWGGMPLAFTPGSAWDYSNTNYVIAGRIVELVSGQTLNQVLTERIFKPLGMSSAIDNERVAPTRRDAERYTRNLLGPARPIAPAAAGWAFAAGGLSMTATDLARWNASLLRRSLLAPGSYEIMMRETTLTTGKGSGYALGLYVDGPAGHRRVYHNGFAPGVITESRIYPDDGLSIVVAANAEFGMVVPEIADGIEKLLSSTPFPAPDTYAASTTETLAAPAFIRGYIKDLRLGRIDCRHLTPEACAYFTPEVLADYRQSFVRLGREERLVIVKREKIGADEGVLFEMTWPTQKIIGALRKRPDGKVSDLWLMAF